MDSNVIPFPDRPTGSEVSVSVFVGAEQVVDSYDGRMEMALDDVDLEIAAEELECLAEAIREHIGQCYGYFGRFAAQNPLCDCPDCRMRAVLMSDPDLPHNDNLPSFV